MADEIVLVQPLHDDDDGATALVIEPAVESVHEPLVAGLPLRLGERFLRLQRIVDQDDVGAASALSRSSPPTFAWSVTAVALSPAIPPSRGPHSGFPDQGGKFPDRRFKFPVRPQIIPCSDAQGIGP